VVSSYYLLRDPTCSGNATIRRTQKSNAANVYDKWAQEWLAPSGRVCGTAKKLTTTAILCWTAKGGSSRESEGLALIQ
jgi:hypothetical protein